MILHVGAARGRRLAREARRCIATGTNTDERFQHSSRWPRKGRDKFMLVGGETNAQPQCDDTVGAFMVWDATAVLAPAGFSKGSKFTMLSRDPPAERQLRRRHGRP